MEKTLNKPMRWALASPERQLPIQLCAFFATIYPFAVCIIDLLWTFIFQFDKVSVFTIPDCPTIRTYLPPLSYSVLLWEPQRSIWLCALYFHIPARLILIYLYAPVFTWYFQTAIFTFCSVTESIGMILMSVLHVGIGFELHASCYGIWGISFIINMIMHTELHRLHRLGDKHKRASGAKTREQSLLFQMKFTLPIKYIMIALVILNTFATGIIYLYAISVCSTIAYTIFVGTEYFMIFSNCFFYSILLYEYTREFSVYQITALRLCETEVKTATTAL